MHKFIVIKCWIKFLSNSEEFSEGRASHFITLLNRLLRPHEKNTGRCLLSVKFKYNRTTVYFHINNLKQFNKVSESVNIWMESRKRNKSFDDAKFDEHEKPNLSGDYGNIAILTLLYLMQGIPLGITYSMPFILQNKGVSYKDQAAFSFAFYPFTSNNLSIRSHESTW